MILIILASLFFSCNSGDEEVIIVPKNYTGYIVIIYNQKNGESVKYENGKRVYQIPSNGILKTQFKGNYGLRDFTKYYFNNISDSNKIPSFIDFNAIPTQLVVGLKGSNGNANIDFKGKETVEFSLYYIGTKEDILLSIEKAEKLDILTLLK